MIKIWTLLIIIHVGPRSLWDRKYVEQLIPKDSQWQVLFERLGVQILFWSS